MAPLTWRNVDAPDLSAAANMMARASEGIQQAFKTGGQIGKGIHADKVDIGSREAMLAAAKISDSEQWQKAMKEGTAFGNIDPRFINQETIAWGMGREKELLALETARAAEARAAAAAAGGGGGVSRGGGGGGGGGRRRGSGDGSGGGSDTDKWAVTEAQGALRLAIAEFGEGSPEATAAAERLAGVSAQTESKSGYLDAVDAVGAGITADREAATAAGEAAVAAMGDDAYAETYTPAFDIPGETLPGVSEALAPAPSAIPASITSESLPVPNATAPSGPLPAEDIPPSPVASLGYSMGTPVAAETVQEAAIAPSPDRPALSFGKAVAAADTGPVNGDRPVSWSQYAEEALNEAPVSAGSTEQPAAAPVLKPEEVGMNAEIAARPEWKAFESEVTDFTDYFGKRQEELVANRERGYDNLTPPRDVKTAIDSSRAILETTLKANPEFALYDSVPKMKGILAEAGPEGVIGEVVKTLGVKADDAESMMEEIMGLAASSGVDLPTAASAVIASAGPENRDVATAWYDISNTFSGNTYYDYDKAEALLEKSKAVTEDPAGNISNRNAVGGIRSTLSGLEDQYTNSRKAVVAAEAALAKRPGDSRLQAELETAKTKLLEADKNIIEFTRLLPDRMADMGMEGGPGRKSTAPEMSPELIAADKQMTANVEEYGTKTPGFVGFRNNTFMDGSVTPDSPFGQRQADQWLLPVISGRATEQEQTSFFEWVSKSPEAKSKIFGKIQEMDYAGEDFDLPDEVQAAYDEYAKSKAPMKAIQDFSSLGFDVAKDPTVAAALANDPEIKSAMESWNNAQSLFTLPGTRRRAEEAAKEAIRKALSKRTSE